MAATQIEFTRGDGVHHQFNMPKDAWSSGGTLRFMAKPAIDDDNTDAAAVITQEWNDSAVSDVTINGVAYKQYDCYFPGSATNGIASDGAASTQYLGEFQWTDSTGNSVTFPANDPKLNVVVYFDVIREHP